MMQLAPSEGKDMTDAVEAQPTVAPDEGSRRGRPRPDETLKRDERVLAAIGESGSTRDEIATALGDIPPQLVYLSLHRLRAASKVERARDGGKHTWKRVTAADPVPVS
jgi:hypothetical protein